MKEVHFGDEAVAEMKAGVDILANAVKDTLGPSGRNVVIEREYGAPSITKDGVSVAKAIDFGKGLKAVGASLVKEVASKTGSDAGDGTTTATVLAQAILESGYDAVKGGSNAVHVRQGIEMAASAAVKAISEMAVPVKDEEVANVASISANSKEYGKIIADAFASLGYKSAVITVDSSKTLGVTSEVVKGMRLDKGYASPYMVNDQYGRQAVYQDAYVLVTDRKISYVRDLLPIVEKVAESGSKELVIIADDVDTSALSTIIGNHINGIFHVLIVKAPSFGDNRRETLTDIAILTGARVSSDANALALKDLKLSDLGRAGKIVADRDTTTIIDGAGEKAAIDARVETLRVQHDALESDFDRGRIKERMAKLSGGIGIIKVGAVTETETKEIQDRIEDSVAATKAAIEEGIVAGGGATLLRVRAKLDAHLPYAQATIPDGVNKGIAAFKEALVEPLRIIAVNAGYDGDSVLKASEALPLDSSEGFNAVTGKYVDLVADGVIDPAKVTRTAVQNAASIASLLVTTSSVICIKDEKSDMPIH